ncbi:MAG: Hsp20/alpha crystallin family protein, partial [Chloroflexi bacterium]|nr:Hsp20/alpha crystallin family protein [Chloroflexota bacterium]
MDKGSKGPDTGPLIGGTLNILGLKIDLGELLTAPESLQGQLEELRERLKQAGGKVALSDEEWKRGDARVTGYVRTKGILGDREYHVGAGRESGRRARPAPEPPEVLEPPVDVFDEPEQVTVVADVPGVNLDDLELRLEGDLLSLSTKPGARRLYRKEIRLEASVATETMKATCRNGVLEVRVSKRKTGSG